MITYDALLALVSAALPDLAWRLDWHLEDGELPEVIAEHGRARLAFSLLDEPGEQPALMVALSTDHEVNDDETHLLLQEHLDLAAPPTADEVRDLARQVRAALRVELADALAHLDALPLGGEDDV